MGFLKELDKLGKEIDKGIDLMGKPGKDFHIALVMKDGKVFGRRYKGSFRMPGIEKSGISLFDPRYDLATELDNGYGIKTYAKNLRKYVETDWIPEGDHFVRLTFYELPQNSYKMRKFMLTRPTTLHEIPNNEVYDKLKSIRKLTR